MPDSERKLEDAAIKATGKIAGSDLIFEISQLYTAERGRRYSVSLNCTCCQENVDAITNIKGEEVWPWLADRLNY